MSTAPVVAAPQQHGARRTRQAVIASSLGNVLEWYDIILFGFMSSTISAVFYPGKGLAADLMTWATFAITFAVRPLGAILIGNYADKHGRRPALSLTIGLMTLGVAIIVLTPGYTTLGNAAPMILAVARLIQGISAGGEFGSATAFMTENAENNKVFHASWQVSTQGLAMIMASGIAWIFTSTLARTDLLSWGWRIPFVIGLLIGPVGWWIRTKMSDTSEFEAATPVEHAPVVLLLRHHAGRLAAAFMIVGMPTLSVYLITYLPSYAAKTLALSSWSAYPGAVLAGTIIFIGSPLVGRLAERVGPTTIMLYTSAAGVIIGIPMFLLLRAQASLSALTACETAAGLVVCLFASMPGMFSELFPIKVRSSGMTIAYSSGVALLGGIAPLILDWLVSGRRIMLAPAYYYVGMCTLSLLGLSIARGVFKAR